MTTDHVTAAENRDAGRRLAFPAAREIQVRILRFLHEHGQADDGTIADATGLKLATVRRRRAELVRAGVVTQTDTGHWQAVPPLSATCPPANGQAPDTCPQQTDRG